MELVSIICAARNEEKTIKKSLDSLLSQANVNKEIIIITDGSEDKTDEISGEYAKKNKIIKHFILDTKQGITKSRAFGVSKSNGSIIFVVDADAWYESDYLEKCILHLKDETVGGVIGKIRVWDPKTFISKFRDIQYKLKWDDEDYIKKEISNGKIAAWIFRRKLFDQLGGYNLNVKYGEDIDLTRRMLKAGYKIVYEPNVLWYHLWKEYPKDVIRNSFEVGKLNYSFNKRNFKTILKVIYFLLPFPILILSILNLYILIILFLYILPMFIRGLELFAKSKSKNRVYALLFPIVALIGNIPYSIGFTLSFFINLFKKND